MKISVLLDTNSSMPTENYLGILKAFIKAIEGEYPDPYLDTVGIPTIGWEFALKSGEVKTATMNNENQELTT